MAKGNSYFQSARKVALSCLRKFLYLTHCSSSSWQKVSRNLLLIKITKEDKAKDYNDIDDYGTHNKKG